MKGCFIVCVKQQILANVLAYTRDWQFRESFLNGKSQYHQPPHTYLFRSAAFYIENIIYHCYKTSYLIVEVSCT